MMNLTISKHWGSLFEFFINFCNSFYSLVLKISTWLILILWNFNLGFIKITFLPRNNNVIDDLSHLRIFLFILLWEVTRRLYSALDTSWFNIRCLGRIEGSLWGVIRFGKSVPLLNRKHPSSPSIILLSPVKFRWVNCVSFPIHWKFLSHPCICWY